MTAFRTAFASLFCLAATSSLAIDHGEFGSNRSKLTYVIDSTNLARDSGEKPVSTFSHSALADELDPAMGKALFDRKWAQAPASTNSADGLGPLFNAGSCATC